MVLGTAIRATAEILPRVQITWSPFQKTSQARSPLLFCSVLTSGALRSIGHMILDSRGAPSSSRSPPLPAAKSLVQAQQKLRPQERKEPASHAELLPVSADNTGLGGQGSGSVWQPQRIVSHVFPPPLMCIQGIASFKNCKKAHGCGHSLHALTWLHGGGQPPKSCSCV